ncbi:probable O-methyltransferase 3 [Prosopis cineraria]|uniref:probable O-methyltransferase 3 n=1 Tax=Prosopis cineraria TaxID=364024 RepID=UPI0024102488|nr:probable O-methyltransferase 3 [Prosopis cineraria]
METRDRSQASILLGAQICTWNLIFSFINSVSVKCAVDLGIPDIIHNHGRPMPLSELIISLPIHASKATFVPRLMRLFVHNGLFSQQQVPENSSEEAYALTSASKLLLSDNTLSVTPLMHVVLNPVLMKPFFSLSSWFQNDDPTPFNTVHGKDLWEYAGQDPELNQMFNYAMASDAQIVTSVVIERCTGMFAGLESLVDVGGGTGTLAKAIAKTFPLLKCTVFDLPHVVAGLQGSGNLKYVAGDMFKEIPPANAILLKGILHDWNDGDCVKILKKCKEAITSNGNEGKVIVIDIMIEHDKKDDKTIEAQLFSDMIMMALVTGRERNEKEWANLIITSGFSDYKVTPVLGIRSIIEVYP